MTLYSCNRDTETNLIVSSSDGWQYFSASNDESGPAEEATCSWIITSPNAKFGIELEILDYNLNFDHLKIYEQMESVSTNEWNQMESESSSATRLLAIFKESSADNENNDDTIITKVFRTSYSSDVWSSQSGGTFKVEFYILYPAARDKSNVKLRYRPFQYCKSLIPPCSSSHGTCRNGFQDCVCNPDYEGPSCDQSKFFFAFLFYIFIIVEPIFGYITLFFFVLLFVLKLRK